MERSLTLRQSAVAVSILASLWLLKHPYKGIWHDSIVYTFSALSKLYPDTFKGDLFVKFGSQYVYTIFPQIYAVLINVFGIYTSALMLTILGQLLWVFAAVTFFRTFFKGKELYISLAIVFFMKSYYGSSYALQFAEPFVTSRIFSEALCILGTTAIIKERHAFSAILFLVSFLIHPLMTIGAGFIVYIYLVLSHPRVLFSAPIIAGAVGLLGLFKIEPFAGIFRIFTPEWLQVLRARSSLIFLMQWSLIDWAELFFSISITAAAFMIAKGVIRRLFLSAIVGACCGMLVNLIGGEMLKIELALQIEAWRSLWFLQFISAMGSAMIIFNFLKLKENALLLCSFFALTWYSVSLGATSFVITLIFFHLTVQSSRDRLAPIEMTRPIITLVSVIVLLGLISPIMLLIKSRFDAMVLSQVAEYEMLNLFPPLILSLVIFIFFLNWSRTPSLKLIITTSIILIFSLAAWDRESPWFRMLESNQDSKAFFRDILPDNATILWDASSKVAWFGARRPSYISSDQGSGSPRCQKTAIEYEKRVNAILPLMDESPLTSTEIRDKLGWRTDQSKFKSGYHEVCRNAQDLDYIVSTIDIPGKSIAHWHSPVATEKVQFLDDDTFERIKEQDFYLYDCSEYKAAQAKS